MLIYGIVIFILLFTVIRSLVVQSVCKLCNVEKIFKTKKCSICVNVFTDFVTIILSLLSYMFLVKIGL
jgi:hypothetical protein